LSYATLVLSLGLCVTLTACCVRAMLASSVVCRLFYFCSPVVVYVMHVYNLLKLRSSITARRSWQRSSKAFTGLTRTSRVYTASESLCKTVTCGCLKLRTIPDCTSWVRDNLMRVLMKSLQGFYCVGSSALSSALLGYRMLAFPGECETALFSMSSSFACLRLAVTEKETHTHAHACIHVCE